MKERIAELARQLKEMAAEMKTIKDVGKADALLKEMWELVVKDAGK